MNPLYPIVIIVSIALFGFGLIQQQITVHTSPQNDDDLVASDTANPAYDISPTVQQPTTTSTPIQPMLTPPSNPLSPTPTKTTMTTSIDTFVYPNATIADQTNSSFRLTSSDNPETITNWYKEKIEAKNMQINSFVTTSSNDNVLNKLGGAGNDMNILITIERKPGDSTTTITGKLDAPSSSLEVNIHNEIVN